MNSRRKFFGQIATIFASSILLPKYSDRFIWKPSNNGIQENHLQLTSTPIIAKCQKLKVIWTVDFEQELQCYYSINVEKQITELVKSQHNIVSTYPKQSFIDYVM